MHEVQTDCAWESRELAHATVDRCMQAYGASRQSGCTKFRRIVHGKAVSIYRKGIWMNRLIHIGFGNIVNTEKIIAIVSPDAAPVKRMVQRAKENGMAIDATQGRKTKAVLVMENSQVVLSALLPETIAGRAQENVSGAD